MAVVQQAYDKVVSTRKVDDLVQSLRMTGISEIQVSRMSSELDTRVRKLLSRPLSGRRGSRKRGNHPEKAQEFVNKHQGNTTLSQGLKGARHSSGTRELNSLAASDKSGLNRLSEAGARITFGSFCPTKTGGRNCESGSADTDLYVRSGSRIPFYPEPVACTDEMDLSRAGVTPKPLGLSRRTLCSVGNTRDSRVFDVERPKQFSSALSESSVHAG